MRHPKVRHQPSLERLLSGWGAPASEYVPVDSDEALPVVSVHSIPKLFPSAFDEDRSDIGESHDRLPETSGCYS